MYINGEGNQKKDITKALYWAEKAANQDLAQAQFDFATMQLEYTRGDSDDQKAFYWFEKIAMKNDPSEKVTASAQYALARMYYNGVGTLTNKKKAANWCQISFKNGNKSAKKLWNKLELWRYLD